MHRTAILGLASVVLFAGLRPISGVEIHVAVTGDDAASGSEDQPLATIARARDLARQQKDHPVKILLHGGNYYLDETIVFTAEDSRPNDAPLLLTAVPSQRVVISGGQRLVPQWQAYRDGIFQANVPTGSKIDQLFVNGERQHLARYPNYDPESQYFQGFSTDSTAADRVKTWGNPVGGVVHAMHRSLWGDMHWEIAGKTAEGQLELIGGWQNNRQMGAHKEYRFVENIFEELDAPGEWYLDEKQSLLYFYPPPGLDLADAKYEGVQLPHLFEFRGSATNPVRNIAIEGLLLTHTTRTFMENKEPLLRSDWTTYRGGTIVFDGAEDCTVRDCFLDQVGGNAIFVNNYNRRIKVVKCHVADAGANAISFVGNSKSLRSPLFEYHQTAELPEIDKTPGPKTNDYPANCTVQDCLIYRNGRVEKQTAGVNICTAESITIRQVSIYDCPRAGINICNGAFGGHVIEFCDVFDTVKETGDHGSFNSWGRDRFWHPDRKVTARWLEQYPDMPKWDCQKTIVLRNNRWRCDHGWDIDLDDGSSNYEIYNNLCLAGGIKLREGYYRNVFNNIVVNYTFCPHVWYPNCHTAFRHNIIWQDKYATAGMRSTDQVHTVNKNLVHERGGELRPVEELAKFGGDQHSMIGDAKFLDPSNGDYRVQDKSPAMQLGFSNFSMDQFGVLDPRLKAIARKPPLPGSLEAAGIASGGWGREYNVARTADWLGAKLKDIENEGEMSAVGLGDKNGVLVVEVPGGTLAHESGLRENDVIRRVNGVVVQDLKGLASEWQDLEQAKAAQVMVWRDQAERRLDIPRR